MSAPGARGRLIATVRNYYGLPESTLLSDESESVLVNFLQSSQSNLLKASLTKNNTVNFETQIGSVCSNAIIFYKMKAESLEEEDSFKNIGMITFPQTPIESLYLSLRHVYTPLLLADNNAFSAKLQQSILELESSLRVIAYGKETDNTNVILTVEDEKDYWDAIVHGQHPAKERAAAAAFCDLFQQITDELRSLQTNVVTEIQECLENVGGLLDDIWRHNTHIYPQSRMIHILDIISNYCVTSVQNILSSLDIWKLQGTSKDSEVLITLQDSSKAVGTWRSACSSLTDTYWPNHSLHPWQGKPYEPQLCRMFHERLNAVYDIRSVHHQLNKLLTMEEQDELNTANIFEAFEKINIWIYTPGNRHIWESAVAYTTSILKPAEIKIAEKLKPRLHNSSTKQMLHEFMRYKSLIERPIVKQSLRNELEIFISSLGGLLKEIEGQIDSEETFDGKNYRAPEMSAVVQQIQWAKQTETRVLGIKNIVETLLEELEGSADLLQMTKHVLNELKSMYTRLYEEWTRDLQAEMKAGSLQLSVDKPVVEFSSSSRMMIVRFNPKLVSVESSARAMAALGMPPPPSVREAIDKAAQFLQQARALQQVTSFHNTLGERMIPSCRGMMLQAALELSSLVQEQRSVYWGKVAEVTQYADSLRQSVVKLESQNSYLTSQHVAIRNIVAKLMDTDLLGKHGEWKKLVRNIREIIEKVEERGYKNTAAWRTHWDTQLFKALECQYIKTLLSLHKHFPPVQVELVFRGHKVVMQPPMEELRIQHYNQLRRLVSLPSQFVGLQTDVPVMDSAFNSIVQKHSWLGNKAVKQMESALSGVERVVGEWTRRAALGAVESVEALCREHLRSPDDWPANFKACKAYGQAVAKMTFDDEKVEWISIGTMSLRREFEAQVRNLWACLISSLQASCQEDVALIDSFIANAQLTLEKKAVPKNARELAEISAAQNVLQEKFPEMAKTVEDLKKKQHTLRTWGGDQSIDSTIKEWMRIQEMMSSQQQLFEHQAEIVKSGLSGEWRNLSSSVEVWLSRWTQTRLKLAQLDGVSYEEMQARSRQVADAQAQWQIFCAERQDILKESEKFNIHPEISDHWKEAEKILAEDAKTWEVFKEYDEAFSCLGEQEWIVFQKKLHLLDEFVTEWGGRMEPYTTITLYLQQDIDKYKDMTPLLKYLRGTDFTERHWREVFGLLELANKRVDTLLLKDLLKVAGNIKKHIKTLQKISASATSESAIRGALNDLELWYAGARFTITYYKDKAGKSIPIVKDFKEILSKVEEQQWVVWSVRGGAGGAAEEACGLWEARLRAAQQLTRATHHAQRRWLYLEPILSGEQGELGAKFRKVDQGFRQVTRTIENDARLSALLQSPRLQPILDSTLSQLAVCQTALNSYIDDKRSIFPRFYFLSDDDLLELLGQARAGAEGREQVMQTHLKKLFPGITGVTLGPNSMSVTALCSHYHEKLTLDQPVDIDYPVEIWLKKLEEQMRQSLKSAVLKCLLDTSFQYQDAFSFPTQILCLAQNIRFTEQTERAVVSKELHKLKENIQKECYQYTEVDQSEDEGERIKKRALILQCSYYLDVLQVLIENNVASTSHWLWQKQLRFYLVSNKEIVARMGLAQISYSYEYLGVNTGQFVRTELTDQCFLILTQAFHLGLVGNPFGPAGTGKTESVKALGGLVGRLVLVFNCDEAMDAISMGRLLTGLALSGAWGCFDEFNRLTAATLSIISHQFSSLLAAMGSKPVGNQGAVVMLNGKEVSVSEWCGVVATLNPVGRGYGGRRALPAALARLLRPAAMCRPAAAPLAHHLLAARSLTQPKHLAYALAHVFNMARDLLSSQQHYDWGLRALKTVVGSCGRAVEVARASGGGALSEQEQRTIVLRAARLNTMSKLTFSDAQRFDAILSMAFPDVIQEAETTSDLDAMLFSSYKALNLVCKKEQVQKCKELYEQLQQRMGVVIVGPPGSGKTTIRQLLKNALNHQGKNVSEHVICPKAMSRTLLMGHIDHDTRQWTDGVISSTALDVSNQSSEVWSWIVCDGDVDPEWIESLNSVLDDNRLLTLPSGWRIQFGPNVNFVFETHSLEHASPATISRMGVILLSDEDSCAVETMEKWMNKLDSENEQARLALPLLQKTINKALLWSKTRRNEFVQKLFSVAIVRQVLVQFDHIAISLKTSLTSVSNSDDIVNLAIKRGLSTALKPKSADKFMEEVCEGLSSGMDMEESCDGGWHDRVYLSPRLVRAAQTLAAALNACAHVLVIGTDACAKNILAEHVIDEARDKLLISINCTPVLEPTNIIDELKRNNVIRTGSKPLNNSQVVLLVKSLQRAKVDAWGTSAVQAFLLQLIQHGGFWERGKGEGDRDGSMQWCSVRAVQIVMTVSYQGARLCPRLTNTTSVTLLREPDDNELSELAFACLSRNVSKVVPDEQIRKIAARMLALYKEVSETFYSQPHYRWNTSDLARWCDNIQWYRPNDVDTLLQAVYTESQNIFRNRLINDNDTSKFDSIKENYINVSNMDGMYFAPKLHRDGVYMELVNYKDWYQTTQKIINQCITESEQSIFGDSGAEVCGEIATMCSAIARSVNGEVVVCVGSSGFGRRAATHVVSTALPARLYIAREPKDFNQQIKNAISSAGSEGCKTIILLEESMNRDIELCVLGSVEAVVQATSLTHLPDSLQPSGTQHGDSSTSILSDIKRNLGIVILLDKNHIQLSDFLEKYPFLYRRSNILWLDRWGSETLHRMPQLIIQRLMKENISEDSTEENDSIPVDGFVSIYSSLESEAMLPSCRYINLVKTYYNINRTKKHLLVKRQQTLQAGVAALTKARSEVNALKLDAALQETALSEKQEKATHALNQISATVQSATNHKDEMQALKKNIELENAKLQVRKQEIEEELASVEPVIATARAAVSDIRPEALSEVRSLRAPPDVVRDVLEGVLRLMGIADTSWHSMKNFLSKRGVKEDIRNMDASQITAESLRSVERLLEQRGSSFEDKTSKRASAACAPLAAWVRANVAYAGALQRVQPLQQQQRALFKNLENAEAQLVALSSGLQSVDERVAALKEQLNQYTKEGMEIEIKLNIAKETIVKTETLVDKLSEEYDTWEKDLENISKEISEINLRSLLAAAFVVYLSDVPEDQFRNFMDKWCEGLGFDGNGFSVINFLSSIEEQLKWNANGLPLDISAVKNAVVVNQALQPVRCGFTPLIIDPDGDASAWLQNSLAEFHCDFIPQHSDKLYTAFQHATRFGKILVVEEVTDVDDYWAPLLRGLPIANQTTLHANFKLVLYSRDVTLPSRLLPYHRATLSIIDFTPKLEGLTDQLMHFALQHEKPEINDKLNALKIQKASLQKQQHELQENLLKDLSSNKDILHDANLLSSLANTRATSATIVQALHEARTIEAQMKKMYDKFEESARKAAILLLGVREIAANKYPLVSVPVETLLAVFIEALDSGKVTGEPEALDSERVVKYLTARIVERVMLSLHKSDKHIVILHLLHHVYEHHIPTKLWKVFIGALCNMDDAVANEIKLKIPWIAEENIPAITNLKMVSPELYEKLKLEDGELWKTLMASGDLNSVARLNLTAFEKVVAVQAVRPESLYVAITSLVTSILGGGGGASWDAGGVAAGARWGGAVGGRVPRPVLLLGAHAADQLASYAQAHSHTLHQVWVTTDAEESARELSVALEAARRGGGGGSGGGGWLVLQIGAAPFTPQLQTCITTFCIQKPVAEVEINSDFRFWIVTEDREIPPLIANTCINVVLEAPEGVRNNIMSTLSAWGNWESQDMKVSRMLFCLAILHALIQERRAYTPQGWTQWYPFEWGDISAGHSIITSSHVNSVTSAGLCEALYAGRISNQSDSQILATLVKEFLGEQTFAHAWKPRGVNTTLPFAKQLQAYNSALSAFPLTDSPAQLGLAANVRLAWEKQQSEKIITGLGELNAAVSASLRRKDASNLKPIFALWRRLMSSSPLVKGDYNINKRAEGWWGAVVVGEAGTAARACAAVHSALALAARAPHAHALTHQVPEEWQLLWPGPELMMKYMRELSFRAIEAVKRLEQHKEGDGIPKDMELRSLFNPCRLLAALQASTAEMLGCSPESLALCAKWNYKPEGIRVGAGDGFGGCTVRGLQLEGAVWSEGSQSLTAVDSTAAPRSHLPPILLYFTQQSESTPPPAGTVELPVYASEKREDLLFRVRAPLASAGAGALDQSTAVLNALALVIAEV